MERKSAHIIEYAVLTVLWINLFWLYHKDKNNHCYFWAIFAAFVYAISDEIHQILVFGRTGKATDIGIDFLGILLGTGLYWAYQKKKKRG